MLTFFLCTKCKYNWLLLYARLLDYTWCFDMRTVHALLYTAFDIVYILLLKYVKCIKTLKYWLSSDVALGEWYLTGVHIVSLVSLIWTPVRYHSPRATSLLSQHFNVFMHLNILITIYKQYPKLYITTHVQYTCQNIMYNRITWRITKTNYTGILYTSKM